MGCTRDTASRWECGHSFPQGPRILRLARVLDTFVETLYYDHFTAEKFFALPRPQPERRPIPLNAPLVLLARAEIVVDAPRDFEAWQRQLLTTEYLDATVRAPHHEPMWVPIRGRKATEPFVVPYIQWDSAPAIPKSLLMTVRWIRRYTQGKGEQPAIGTTRLAYENYFSLFARHEVALRMRVVT